MSATVAECALRVPSFGDNSKLHIAGSAATCHDQDRVGRDAGVVRSRQGGSSLMNVDLVPVDGAGKTEGAV